MLNIPMHPLQIQKIVIKKIAKKRCKQWFGFIENDNSGGELLVRV